MNSQNKSFKKHIGITALLFVAAILLLRPTLHFQYTGIYLTLGMVLIAYGTPLLLIDSLKGNFRKLGLFQQLSGALIWAMVVLAIFVSSIMTTERASISGLNDVKTLQTLPSLDVTQVPLVSQSVAHRAMTRRLGEDLGLGSQFEVGLPYKQVYQGRLAWIAPLEPRSFFKALFGDDSPAFMTVDAADPGNVKFVRTKVSISERELIGLDGKLWFKNPTLSAHTWYFEVSDEGTPYWVAPLSYKRAGLLGSDVRSVALLNAQSGAIEVKSLADLPAWVDNVFPAWLVADQIEVTGELVNGWFNPTDDGKFKLSSTPDQVLIDGQMWHLGTVASVSRAESVTEGVLINSRTKELKRFELQGVTEQVAQTAMRSQNPEKDLVASNPVIYLVDGIPAYIAALATRDDVIRGYGVVSVQEAQMVAVADTLDAALKQFAAKRTTSTVSLGKEVEVLELEESVQVIRQDSASGHYYLLLRPSGRLIVGASHLSDELHVTETGDSVKVKVRQAGKTTAPLVEFKNLTKFPLNP